MAAHSIVSRLPTATVSHSPSALLCLRHRSDGSPGNARSRSAVATLMIAYGG